jgi:hypothetical protein
VKFVHTGDGDWTPAKTAQRQKQVSDDLAKAGVRQLKVNEARVDGDEAALIVQRLNPDTQETFNPKAFEDGGRDCLIAEGKWTLDHERAAGELFHELASKGFVWEDCHLANLFFERVDGRLVAGVLDHGRIAKWGELDEVMDYWTRLMQIQPKTHGIRSNAGRSHRYRFGSAQEYMAKMLEHKKWVVFDEVTGTFRPGLIDPRSLDPAQFPLHRWVNPELKKPPGTDPAAAGAAAPAHRRRTAA